MGRRRGNAVCSAIASYDPEVVVLSEVQTHSVSEIQASLWMQRWEHTAYAPRSDKTTNGVCILSRIPVRVRNGCPVPEENAARWIDVDLLPFGFGVGALHIPGKSDQRTPNSKQRFWTALVEAARERIGEKFLFLGDLNTGMHGIDQRESNFLCDKEFEQMTALGWTDAWRQFHGAEFEPSWVSGKGNGFRLDHAFVSPALLPRLVSCEYSHREREESLSDHSILIVEIE